MWRTLMMIARMFGILLLVVLAAGSIAVSAAQSAKAETSTDAYVRRMIEATRIGWSALAAFNEITRVFADVQLLTSDGQRAWLMNAQGGSEIDMEAVRTLGVSYEYKSFDKILWRGRPSVFIGLGKELPADELQRLEDPRAIPDVFSLATHEAFHFYAEDEKSWAFSPGSDRSTLYPAAAEPRMHRNQLIRHLLAAAQGRADALRRASYWYRQWSSGYADELKHIHGTDRSEGSARYVEAIVRPLVLGARPLSHEWSVLMLEELSLLARDDYLAADHESYALGALAGYLLEQQGVDWLPRVARGETPVAMLLDSVPPLDTPPDELMGRRIREVIAESNRQTAQVFDSFLPRFNDPAGKRLLVPNQVMQGSFNPTHSYRLATQPEKIEVGIDAAFVLSDGRIDLRAATVATHVSEDCGQLDLYWILALTRDEFEKTADSRMRFERDDIKVDIPYPAQPAQDPRIWCVQV